MAESDRRQQLLRTASELFSEKGYHATTIRDIAKRIGMLSGSLYAHINSKEDLLFEITDRVADHFLNRVGRVQKLQLSPETKFRQAFTAHIQVVAEHMPEATVFSHEWRNLSEERRVAIQRKRDEYEHLWSDIIAEGVAAGTFTKNKPRFARIVTLSVANWLYQWYDVNGALTPKEVADQLVEVLLSGLLTTQ